MRGLSKTVTIDGRDYIVRELAIWEIRNWINTLSANSVDLIDELLIENVQLSAVRQMASISDEDFEQMPPSELEKIVDAAKQVNHRFFSMVDRVVAASGQKKPSPA